MADEQGVRRASSENCNANGGTNPDANAVGTVSEGNESSDAMEPGVATEHVESTSRARIPICVTGGNGAEVDETNAEHTAQRREGLRSHGNANLRANGETATDDTHTNARQGRELRKLASYNREPPTAGTAHVLNTEHFPEYFHVVGLSAVIPLSEIPVPSNFSEACQSTHSLEWREAMEKELASLRHHDGAELVPRSEVPTESSIIGTRRLYKVKANGKFKARLIVQGYNQRIGIDCERNIFAPVCRMTTQRVLLAIAAEQGWNVINLDVVTAFLQSRMTEDVYVKQAPGFEIIEHGTGKPLVMRLKKSLYGLRQSPRNWH